MTDIPPSATYPLLGLMSGSSLDGLDIAACLLKVEHGSWSYAIEAAATYPFPDNLRALLQEAGGRRTDYEVAAADRELGAFTADSIRAFLAAYNVTPPLWIAQHGHTLVHAPAEGYSLQIGNAELIARATGIPVVSDFRNADIAAGGQGAPLVPICDALLFSDYAVCLNIGGIANISFVRQGERIGYDVCPANQLLNFLAGKVALPYDAEGSMARSGHINQRLLEALEQQPYYRLPAPKSLDNTYVQQHFIALLEEYDIPLNDALRTCTEQIAMRISSSLQAAGAGSNDRILVSGGGAWNTFLIERIQHLSGIPITLPESNIIAFKEALAMALMAALYMRKENNCLPSVTGARYAVSGGNLQLPEHL